MKFKYQLLTNLISPKKRIVDITKHNELKLAIDFAESTKDGVVKFEIYSRNWPKHHLVGTVMPNRYIDWANAPW